MGRIKAVKGEFYHVYNRGVDKKIIFSEQSDYERFVAYLHLLNTKDNLRPADIFDHYTTEEVLTSTHERPLVALGAYCLMPNHFHLYATPLVENGLSKYMQRIQTAYTMYFNQKNGRGGVLFQGAYKTRHVDRDPYAKFLFSYIHLNPASLIDPDWKSADTGEFLRFRNHIRTYPYSSIKEYLSGKHTVTDPEKFPKYFGSKKDIDSHIDMWLRFRTEDAEPIKNQALRGGRMLKISPRTKREIN